MGARIKRSLIGATVLIGVAAVSLGFASQPIVPDALQPNTSGPRQWQSDDSRDTDSLDAKKPALDRSGSKRFGKASYYANFFAGRKMADGNIMDPQTNNAASRTLPLGTTAKVTNLKTGKSAVVTIQDRGPYVDGRIVDLSPATARQIGITKREGIAKVEVAPISVPMPDGRIKLGAAAMDPQLAINMPYSEKSARTNWRAGTSLANWW
jgi:rare lipoprotein A